MTDDEMRDYIATRIMGWHKEQRDCGGRVVPNKDQWSPVGEWWVDDNGVGWTFTRSWHPEKDIDHAMMIVDAMSNRLFGVRLLFINALLNQAREAGNVEALWWFMFMADKPRAVCLAATQVAEAMETE